MLNKYYIEPSNMDMAFLSKPSVLVLKDNWLELYQAFHNDMELMSCPELEQLRALAYKQLNVVKVMHFKDEIFCYKTNILIPNICFKKNTTISNEHENLKGKRYGKD